MTDELTAALDQIKADHQAANTFGANASDPVPRLLAAVEAVLKLTGPSGEIHRDLDGNVESGMIRVVRCDEIRSAIAAALTGTQPDEERSDG